MTTVPAYDCIIVGGGPAGLSAALTLGRCRRRVLVCDSGHPRNERSKAMHGFLSRDGIAPADFGRICREQLDPYPSVELRSVEVVKAARSDGGFVVEMAGGAGETAATLLLATGIADELPRIAGFDRFYARTVHHCPYCDGWEHRDQPLAVLGAKVEAVELAMELLVWSREIVLCSDGPPEFPAEQGEKLHAHGIRVMEDPIRCLEGDGDQLRGIRFCNDQFLARTALFFSPGQRQRSPLAEQLGCPFREDGSVDSHEEVRTHLPGLFVAGNASCGPQLVIIAAAEGVQAALAMNDFLCEKGN